jgi:hypothetical protein
MNSWRAEFHEVLSGVERWHSTQPRIQIFPKLLFMMLLLSIVSIIALALLRP